MRHHATRSPGQPGTSRTRHPFLSTRSPLAETSRNIIASLENLARVDLPHAASKLRRNSSSTTPQHPAPASKTRVDIHDKENVDSHYARIPYPDNKLARTPAGKVAARTSQAVSFMISSRGGLPTSMEQLRAAIEAERDFDSEHDDGLGVLINKEDVDRQSILDMLATMSSSSADSAY